MIGWDCRITQKYHRRCNVPNSFLYDPGQRGYDVLTANNIIDSNVEMSLDAKAFAYISHQSVLVDVV